MEGTISKSQSVTKTKVANKRKPGNIITFLFLCDLVAVLIYPIVFIARNSFREKF